jgi:hypothetical protein
VVPSFCLLHVLCGGLATSSSLYYVVVPLDLKAKPLSKKMLRILRNNASSWITRPPSVFIRLVCPAFIGNTVDILFSLGEARQSSLMKHAPHAIRSSLLWDAFSLYPGNSKFQVEASSFFFLFRYFGLNRFEPYV